MSTITWSPRWVYTSNAPSDSGTIAAAARVWPALSVFSTDAVGRSVPVGKAVKKPGADESDVAMLTATAVAPAGTSGRMVTAPPRARPAAGAGVDEAVRLHRHVATTPNRAVGRDEVAGHVDEQVGGRERVGTHGAGRADADELRVGHHLPGPVVHHRRLGPRLVPGPHGDEAQPLRADRRDGERCCDSVGGDAAHAGDVDVDRASRRDSAGVLAGVDQPARFDRDELRGLGGGRRGDRSGTADHRRRRTARHPRRARRRDGGRWGYEGASWG